MHGNYAYKFNFKLASLFIVYLAKNFVRAVCVHMKLYVSKVAKVFCVCTKVWDNAITRIIN